MPDALSDAKAALAHADNFSGSVKADVQKVAPAPATAPAKPSYTAARAERSTGINSELAAKKQMVDKANQALK